MPPGLGIPNVECRMSNARRESAADPLPVASLCEAWVRASPRSRQSHRPQGDATEKMRSSISPSGMSTLQERLNCALPFQSSLSPGFFRFQRLNGFQVAFQRLKQGCLRYHFSAYRSVISRILNGKISASAFRTGDPILLQGLYAPLWELRS